MKRRLACLMIIASVGYGAEENAGEDRPSAEPSWDEMQIPLQTLLDRSVGLVKRPAIFEWRHSPWTLGVHAGQPVEYNNFNSKAVGLDLRFPGESGLWRTSLVRVKVSESKSSEDLAKTPYRQAGRPSRLEWQNAWEWPLMEGIAHQLSDRLPPSQFLLSGVLQFDSYIYPELGWTALASLIKSNLAGGDAYKISETAPHAMRVSRSLHDLAVGLQWDNFYAAGPFWDFRALWTMKLGGSGGDLQQWLSFSIGTGYAF